MQTYFILLLWITTLESCECYTSSLLALQTLAKTALSTSKYFSRCCKCISSAQWTVHLFLWPFAEVKSMNVYSKVNMTFSGSLTYMHTQVLKYIWKKDLAVKEISLTCLIPTLGAKCELQFHSFYLPSGANWWAVSPEGPEWSHRITHTNGTFKWFSWNKY